ncbi:methyl-accepting chemotaxis protein [Oceanicaulis sp. MMSF_3324]|uniref:methyl-accepting chemotaxis protein n=1 Tax=Oceanicaulis sp. MMSF_3324 TaxID=3046702 RepID=UPI00273EF954|nr:nitrate- and nitrite sensing domain-containing protein [Oceanicaulis sp. MMSF_3324]
MLSNFPITWRMIASVLLPILALLFFASSLVLKDWRLAEDMKVAEEATEFTRDISQLVHELQRERGRSAGFVGSGGETTYRRLMDEQRNATDTALAAYRAARREVTDTLTDPVLQSKLQEIDAQLSELEAHRSQVNTLSFGLGDTVRPYTQTISNMLETVAELAHSSRSGELSTRIIGLLNIMNAKENAGIERAVGSNIYASGQINPALHQRALRLIASQDAFFLEFRELLGREWAQRLDDVLARPESIAVADARENLIAAGYGAPLADMAGTEWFNLTTERIELLMNVEVALAQDIIVYAREVQDRARNNALIALALTLVALILTIAGTSVLMSSVVVPLGKITEALSRLAAGENDVEIQGARRKDEIGVLARTAVSFQQAMAAREEAVREQTRLEQTAMQERRKVLNEMAKKVEAATLESVGSVAKSAQTLTTSSEAIRAKLANAGQTAEQVTRATEQNVKHSGRASELASELTSAIGEVTQQITRGDQMARDAIGEADRSRQSVEELNEAAQQINDFIGLITDIAEQTNLLALNATIEAARAGDAGKGFAVVASEVKALAAQTNQSTTQIAERVAHIQSRTQSTVDAMNAITSSIETIGEVTASVAAAMEEQSASTGSLSDFVEQNSQAMTRVSEHIAELVEISNQSSQDAEEMVKLVGTMSARAEDANTNIPKIVQDAVKAADNRKEGRIPTNYNATLLIDNNEQDICILNASTNGMRVICAGIRKGQTVKLTSPVVTESATVAWTKNGEAGLKFITPITADALQALLDAGAEKAA